MEDLLNWRPHFNVPSILGIVLMVLAFALYLFARHIVGALYRNKPKQIEKAALYFRLGAVLVMAAGAITAIYLPV